MDVSEIPTRGPAGMLVTAEAARRMLGADPAGTVPERASERLVAVVYKLSMYVSLTVLLIYAGNQDELDGFGAFILKVR